MGDVKTIYESKITLFKRLSSKHLVTIRKIVEKKIKKTGKIFFNGFPNTPVTKKPLETRMDKGNTNVSLLWQKSQH